MRCAVVVEHGTRMCHDSGSTSRMAKAKTKEEPGLLTFQEALFILGTLHSFDR